MGRRILTEKTSWDDGYAIVAYTADALALAGDDGDRPIGALASRTERLLAEWEELDTERRAKRRAVGRANALVRRRDVQADEAVTALHNDALIHTKLDRSAPLFTRLFPDALARVVRMSLGAELPILRTLLVKLAEPETPAAMRRTHATTIEQAASRGEQAIRGREESFADAGRTSARVQAWRENANAVLLGVEGVLKQVASERKLGTEWVDSFFPDTDSKRKKPDATTPEAPAPSGT